MVELYKIIEGDCLEELDKLQENSIDAIVTDPPYELNFMGKGWDNAGVSFNKGTWAKCLRVLKPGGYLLAFGGSRTFHRIACAIEDAGFDIRDVIMWLYGSGFPKSMNIGLAIDKKMGVESEGTGVMSPNARPNSTKDNTLYESGTVGKNFTIKKAKNKWDGWGTCLKPSYEPIVMARKPLDGSCTDNVIRWGVGGINIDECRVAYGNETDKRIGTDAVNTSKCGFWSKDKNNGETQMYKDNGRFPANTILTYGDDDKDEVCGGFPNTKGTEVKEKGSYGFCFSDKKRDSKPMADGYNDSGSASRYFYCAKASRKDRDEGLDTFNQKKVNDGRQTPIDNAFQRGETLRKNTHPTVKPTDLMCYLIRLVAPKGSTILDPFMGSGSTGKAVAYENNERNAGYKFIGIEKEAEYCKIAEARIKCAESAARQMSLINDGPIDIGGKC